MQTDIPVIKEEEYETLEVDNFLDSLFGEASGEVPTGEGLTKKQAQDLLISEMNSLIKTSNINRIRHGQHIVASPLNSRQIQQAVFMARQRGGYAELLKNAGW